MQRGTEALIRVLGGNPYHDQRGRFTFAPGRGFQGEVHFTDAKFAGRAEYGGGISVDRKQYSELNEMGKKGLLAHEIAHHTIEDKILSDKKEWDRAAKALYLQDNRHGLPVFIGWNSHLGEAMADITSAYLIKDSKPPALPQAKWDMAMKWAKHAIKATGNSEQKLRADVERIYKQLG